MSGQQFLEKSFVIEVGGIKARPHFFNQRCRNSPGEPLSRMFWKLGPPASGVGAATIRATVTYPDGTNSVLAKDVVITTK